MDPKTIHHLSQSILATKDFSNVLFLPIDDMRPTLFMEILMQIDIEAFNHFLKHCKWDDKQRMTMKNMRLLHK